MPKIGLIVLSSISEALPLVILEGYAAGAHRVHRCGLLPPMIEGLAKKTAPWRQRQRGGIADLQALADAAIALLNDPAEWNRASQAAIARVNATTPTA